MIKILIFEFCLIERSDSCSEKTQLPQDDLITSLFQIICQFRYLITKEVIPVFLIMVYFVIHNLDRQIKIRLTPKCPSNYNMDTKWKIINGVAVAIFIIAALYWFANS
jgi:hypothetical protein